MLRAEDYSENPSGKLESSRQGRSAALIAIVTIALVVLSSPEAKANCQDLLDSDTYRCRVKADDNDRFTDCFRFTSPGVQSEDFDLSIDGFGGAIGCDCKATGTFASPNFGAANSFHCVSAGTAGFGLTFEGAVRGGGRVIIGQAVSEAGTSFFFRCNRAPACALPAATLGAPAASW